MAPSGLPEVDETQPQSLSTVTGRVFYVLLLFNFCSLGLSRFFLFSVCRLAVPHAPRYFPSSPPYEPLECERVQKQPLEQEQRPTNTCLDLPYSGFCHHQVF